MLNSSTIYILRKILGYNHLLKVETKKCLSPILIWIFNFWHTFSWAKKNLKDIEVSVLKSCFISFLQKMYEYIFESFLSQNRLPLRIWILSIRLKTKESIRQVLFYLFWVEMVETFCTLIKLFAISLHFCCLLFWLQLVCQPLTSMAMARCFLQARRPRALLARSIQRVSLKIRQFTI